MAKSHVGIYTVATFGNVVARWQRVSKYLSGQVSKGDFITEPPRKLPAAKAVRDHVDDDDKLKYQISTADQKNVKQFNSCLHIV
ncbi:hypothetical protein ABB44_11650 (plasmid) [Companilactobacillus farciminis]|nr:hypothetical protein ABB45_11610 [Companilactobacillus farciminis]AKS52647.1 hypothetical protein ABB44_11650 [Companilactobacillus farciminis]